MHAWQLEDAKSRFSELVKCALNEGPQLVTWRGNDAVVLLSTPEYRRLAGEDALISMLLQAPRGSRSTPPAANRRQRQSGTTSTISSP